MPPRAPSTTSCRVGSGAQSGDAAAMRRAVIIAVPDGASALASWCSSMTSAVSKNGAASSAKRIISTAPMAKFGAIRQLDRVNADRSAATSSSVKPVVPTTACSPCSPHQAALARAASRTVRSTATSTSAASMAPGSSATTIPATVPPARRRATAATSSRSGSAAMAAHTVVPIRPVAPNTPTRRRPLAVIAAPYPRHSWRPRGDRRHDAALTVHGRSGRTICGAVGHERTEAGTARHATWNRTAVPGRAWAQRSTSASSTTATTG